MKKCWDKRIGELENSSKLIYGEMFFEEWLENHPIDPNLGFWKFLNTVPKEMRLPYISHIFKKLEENQSSGLANSSD